MSRGFTGRHMAVTMTCFFLVVIAVNVVMATAATKTFGGTVVENSYVASQHFNRWLDEANAQMLLGWSAELQRRDGHATLVLRDHGELLAGASIRATAHHPLGRLPDMPLRFVPLGIGRYETLERLPAGRWQVRLEVADHGRAARFLTEVPA